MINNETIDNIKLEKILENSWKQYSDFLSDTNNREDILNSLNFKIATDASLNITKLKKFL